MLSRQHRLPTKLFGEVMKDGRSIHSSHFTLRILRLNPIGPSRFSFSVPKKVDTRATQRNLIRRKSSAFVEKHISSLPEGYGGIFFAKKGVQELEQNILEKELKFLLEKAFKLAS